ncbi:Ecdysone-induced protein 78C-like protein [Aphelenchoides besseyi]|nr:Ecdysone-induced protein 78C-like protein [Aphelenchoides besseyi]
MPVLLSSSRFNDVIASQSDQNSSLVHKNDNSDDANDGRHCLVCGGFCAHGNYGVDCCNACAAFFRRSVKQGRSYICPRGKQCRVDTKRTCRYCRFERCIGAGMSINYILSKHQANNTPMVFNPEPGNSEDEIFRKMTESFGSTFVQRFHAKTRTYQWCGLELKRTQSSLSNTMHTLFAEFEVMLRYLQTSGVCEYLNGPDELRRLCGRLFYPWKFINCCWSTMKNGGFRENTIFFADESSVKVSHDAAEEYLRSIPQLRNSGFIASSLATLHLKAMNAGIKFHKFNMDSTDFAFICQIISLHFAIQMFPWKIELKDRLNVVFKALSKHNRENFLDYSIRLGNLMLMINEATTFIKEFEEWVTILTLSGCKSMLSQVLETWELDKFVD